MNSLLGLLPPSIGADPAIQAAGQAAGDQEAAVRALIPQAYLWSRLDQLPDPVLDHLGWSLHIDGWEYTTTRAQRLWLVRHFYEWHVHKGTEHGLALYWRVLLGRTLLKATPPQKNYLGRSLTAREREAFEAPHPEIRVYPFAHAGVKRSFFCGDRLGDPAAGWAVFPARTDALLRAGSRVELMDPLDGRATPLHDLLYDRSMAERLTRDQVEVRLPGRAVGWFAGRHLIGCLVDHGAAARFYTLHLAGQYRTELERRTTLSLRPGLELRSVYYRLERRPGRAGWGCFLANRYPDQFPDTGGAAFVGRVYPTRSDAARRVYRRFKLFDPARVSLAARRAMAFLGAFRLGGMPAHTAEVALDLAARRPAGAFHTPLHLGGFPYVSDAAARIARARQVGCLAKRLSDKIELAITNRKPVTASAGLLAGSAKAGDYRMEVF